MSGINGKGQRSIKKKYVEESLIPSVTYKTVRFMHEATDGETVIDTASLTAPTDAVNNGFAQPSGTILGALNLLQYKDKVVVRSTLRPAMLQFIDYRISGAATIVLLVPAQEGEIFEVIVSDETRSGMTAVDAVPLVKTYTLPPGSTDISVGPYDVGKYPSEQMGSLMVFVDGQLQYRTVGNQPAGAGDYYELANIIRMVNTDVVDRQVVVVSHSALIQDPQGSLLSMVETLTGQVDNHREILEAITETTISPGAPNNADLKAFGDRVLTNENDITILQQLLTARVAIRTPWADFTPAFNNGPTFTVAQTFQWKRDGSDLLIRGRMDATGTGAAGVFGLQIGSIMGGITVTNDENVGTINSYTLDGDPGYNLQGAASNVANNEIRMFNNGTGSAITGSTITSGDQLMFNIRVQIQEWADTETLAEQLGL